jgi:precorrin-6A/cobalt-precorrin-6A reductase
MIFVLGGTAETAGIADELAAAGFDVLVSTQTDVPLETGTHPGIKRRSGALDRAGMVALGHEKRIRAIVDVSHPYATNVKANAESAASELGIPYLSWIRTPTLTTGGGLRFVDTHEEAAALAFSFGRPVLLTTGSRNLAPYVDQRDRTGVRLVVRVLPHPDSREACRRAGIDARNIIAARGPFSVEENRAAIRKHGIGVVVTKDSGAAGGVPAKIKAAEEEDCVVVALRRPAESSTLFFSNASELVAALTSLLKEE